jgi:hypothetical protein
MASEYYRTGASHPELRKAWAGEAYKSQGSSDFRVNVIQGLIENFVSAMVPQNIRARGLAKRHGGDKAARNVQDLFNNDFIPNSKLNEKIDKAVTQAAIYSDAFIKLGFTDLPRRRFDGENDEILIDDESTLQLGAEMEDPDSTVDQAETPWYDVVMAPNVIPAPGAMALDESPWIAIKMRKRYSELLKNRNYKNIDRVQPQMASKEDWEDHPHRESELLSGKEEGIEESGEDYLDIYEIWHIEGGQLLAVAHGNHDFFIREQDWPHPGLEGYPLVQLQFKNDPEAFFGISMIQDVADLQDELNIASSYMLTAMKRAMPFNIYDKDRIDPKEVADMANAELGGFVGVETSANGLAGAVETFPKGAAFSPDLYGVRNMIIQSILLVSGQSDFMIGQSQKTKSATEVAATSQGMTSRLGYKRKLLIRALSEILKKTYQISRTQITEERFIRTNGIPGANIVTVTPEDLKTELEIDLNAEMAETRGEDPVRLKITADAMAPFLDQALAQAAGIDLVAFAREYLRNAGVKNVDDLQPGSREPTDPEDENIILAEGIQVEPHPLDDDQEHILQHIAIQDGLPPTRQAVLQEHIQLHLRNLQLKQQAIQQRNADLSAQGAATTGANEAPSRTSAASDNGNTQARSLQATN